MRRRQNKRCKGNHSPPPVDRPISSKLGNFPKSPLFPPYRREWCYVAWSTPLASLDLPTCVPPNSPEDSLQEQSEEQRGLCTHCSAAWVCYQHCFGQNPNHSTLWAVLEKMNFVPARPLHECSVRQDQQSQWEEPFTDLLFQILLKRFSASCSRLVWLSSRITML